MKRIHLIFVFHLLSTSLLANDSLKVKTVEYWENDILKVVIMKDTLGRNTKRFDFADEDSSNVFSIVNIYEYYPNSNNRKSILSYYFKQVNGGIYFDNVAIGHKEISEYNPDKRILKEKYLQAICDKKFTKRVIPLDSINSISLEYAKISFPNTRPEFIYYKNANDLTVKYIEKSNGKKEGEYNYIYDNKGRVINVARESSFQESVKIAGDGTNLGFYSTKFIKESSLEKTIFDDEKLTGETITQVYRKKKLYKKEQGREIL